jgi:diguanylate cyclase (GGDEF)-like protein
MLGYSPEEMNKLHVWDWDIQFSREEILELLRVVDTTGAHFETQQRRKDGTSIDVELSNNGAFYKGKKLIFCIVRDITERKEAEEKIHTLAITDGLTGIINRLEFSRILKDELERAGRYGTTLSLIMYDLDHFKSINDRFGHDGGDYVLRTVVGLVNDNIRSSDVQARWGGEEFMVLLPQSELAAAERAAEKLREVIAQHRFDRIESVTASFGVVELKPEEDSNALEKRADDALYRAKAKGRNRVESAGGE